MSPRLADARDHEQPGATTMAKKKNSNKTKKQKIGGKKK